MSLRLRFFPFVALLTGVMALTAPATSFAQSEDDVIAELQAQVAALTARLSSLEAKRAIPVQEYEQPRMASATSSPNWYDRISIKGDFRYRHEYIDAENSDNRNRQRIRARPELKAQVIDTVDVGFGLATGSDDPVSSNQTLGDGASSKQINLDLAYVNWQTPIDGVSLVAGKFKNPLLRVGNNSLIWDGDLRPEGSAIKYKNGNWYATGLALWLQEDSGNDDSVVWAAEAGWQKDFDNFNLKMGAGYVYYNTKGKAVFYDGDPRGNSVNVANEYLYDYSDVELFTEARFKLADIPTMLFVDIVQNQDADNNDTGVAVGGVMNFNHRGHPWEVGYTYQNLQADATYALVTDSDFIGGGTDGKGHIISGSYSITKAIEIGSTLFINERGGATGPWEDYNRLMLDVAFKY